MEYIRIDTPERRLVFIDGQLSGSTNVVIRVEPGTHTITLRDPAAEDEPLEIMQRKTVVRGTTVDRPLVLDFER
jgi:hypothetical protein